MTEKVKQIHHPFFGKMRYDKNFKDYYSFEPIRFWRIGANTKGYVYYYELARDSLRRWGEKYFYET